MLLNLIDPSQISGTLILGYIASNLANSAPFLQRSHYIPRTPRHCGPLSSRFGEVRSGFSDINDMAQFFSASLGLLLIVLKYLP